MRIVIHADASAEIGTGHVVRCLALAATLRRNDDTVVLAAGALLPALAERAHALGVEVVARDEAPRDPDWVVIDGYHLDEAARQSVADARVRRLVVDDLGGGIDADLVLNQNLYASPTGPTSAPSGELLAGPAYALLRPEFDDAEPEREQPPFASRLLITMGGSDPHDATSAVITALARREPFPEARVIIGGGHPDPTSVEDAASAAGFEIVHDAPTLAPHLAWADMLVSACGTTVLEAARLGRPLVGIVLAENQVAVARALEREGLGIVAGRHPSLDADLLVERVDRLRRDLTTRRQMAARGPALVDGQGARRVSQALGTGPLRLRAATMEDAERLLAWRNDPVTRAASFETGVVDEATHRGWLEGRLAGRSDRLWIGAVDGEPVGVVRFALEDGLATASVTVAPEHRRRGLAVRLIAAGCARLAAESTAHAVEAWIRRDNEPSVRAFRSAGFRLAREEPDRLRLRLSLASVP